MQFPCLLKNNVHKIIDLSVIYHVSGFQFPNFFLKVEDLNQRKMNSSAFKLHELKMRFHFLSCSLFQPREPHFSTQVLMYSNSE